MKRKQHKRAAPPLHIADFMCRQCSVQATRDEDHICGICKALGKSVEPPAAARHGFHPAARLSELFLHWFIKHHFIKLKIGDSALKS